MYADKYSYGIYMNFKALSLTLLALLASCSNQKNNIQYDDYPYALSDVRDWDFGSIFDSDLVTVRAGNSAEDEDQRESSAMYEQSGLSNKNIGFTQNIPTAKPSTPPKADKNNQSNASAAVDNVGANNGAAMGKNESGVRKIGDRQRQAALRHAIWDGIMMKVSNMPILSASQSAGVLSTDWFTHDNDKKHKYKMTIAIRSLPESSVSIDATVRKRYIEQHLQVSIFKLEMQNGTWIAVSANPKAAQVAKRAIAEDADRIYSRSIKK